MRREATSRLAVFRRSMLGVGALLAVNAVACGDSSVLSSSPRPDGGSMGTGTGGRMGAGGDPGSGGSPAGSGGSQGSGGSSAGSGGFPGSVGSPGWREARMIGLWEGDDEALRVTACTGQALVSTPFHLNIKQSLVTGMLVGEDGEGCTWHVSVEGSAAAVAAGSTCRRVHGSDISLFTVNRLSIASAGGWTGTVVGELTLTITSPTRTLGCTVSMEGQVSKSPR